MKVIDTHCHIHSDGYGLDADMEYQSALGAGVEMTIVVGEGIDDVSRAIEFAKKHKTYAVVGVHPHQAISQARELDDIEKLILSAKENRIVAIGECGLDYFYMHAPKDAQIDIFKKQIELSLQYDLPLVFHVRGSQQDPNDAFNDFFRICDSYPKIRGEVHSFSYNFETAMGIVTRGMMLGLNGIITFSKSAETKEMLDKIPLENVLLETDSPYLTPEPFRGKINSPQYVVEVGKYLAKVKSISYDEIAAKTTANARRFFSI